MAKTGKIQLLPSGKRLILPSGKAGVLINEDDCCPCGFDCCDSISSLSLTISGFDGWRSVFNRTIVLSAAGGCTYEFNDVITEGGTELVSVEVDGNVFPFNDYTLTLFFMGTTATASIVGNVLNLSVSHVLRNRKFTPPSSTTNTTTYVSTSIGKSLDSDCDPTHSVTNGFNFFVGLFTPGGDSLFVSDSATHAVE